MASSVFGERTRYCSCGIDIKTEGKGNFCEKCLERFDPMVSCDVIFKDMMMYGVYRTFSKKMIPYAYKTQAERANATYFKDFWNGDKGCKHKFEEVDVIPLYGPKKAFKERCCCFCGLFEKKDDEGLNDDGTTTIFNSD